MNEDLQALVNALSASDALASAPPDGPALRERWERRLAQHVGEVLAIVGGNARGMAWSVSDLHAMNAPYVLGRWDGSFQRVLAAILRPGDVFLDVGAHAGFHALGAAALVGPEGRVYAFEPSPALADLAERHASLNALDNLEVIRAALAERDEAGAEFTVFAGSWSGVSSLGRSEGGTILSVETRTLDRFVMETLAGRAPAAVKIDVEGAENLVLRGGSKLLSCERPPTMLIELHEERSALEVCERLYRADYEIVSLSSSGRTRFHELGPTFVEHIAAAHRSAGGRERIAAALLGPPGSTSGA